MSPAIVQSILTRAAADPEFRGRLLQSPASTLADYNLSSAESLALRGLTPETFDGPAGELEARLSPGIIRGDHNLIGG